jgi:pantetheine-phosphate adenylyltransferase
MFTLEQRKNFIEKTFEGETKISVKTYEGLTVNFCERINASFILRGLRNPADFEFEKAIAHTNRSLSDIETVFLLTSTETSFISSSIVREVIQNHGDYAHLVPKAVTDS